MTATSKTILFFGNERLATGLGTSAPALRGLIDAGYKIAAVVVAQNDGDKSRKARPLEVAEIAEQHGIPVLSPQKLSKAVDQLKEYKADAAVLAAYGKIVSKEVLDLFPTGIINIHPSLLPKHRGSTPIESALLRGEAETGVSLMRLTPQMDAGPVFAQQTVPLAGDETKQALADKLSQLGADMVIEHLPAILDGSLQPVDQSGRPTTNHLLTKDDTWLDWQQPAEKLERQVRAYAGWPRSRCLIGTQEVIITEAHVAIGEGVAATLWLDGKQLGMNCADGILVFDKLIPAGKKEMSAHDFLLGYKP